MQSQFFQKLQGIRELRNENINCVEKTQIALCILLMIMGLVIVISGASFIKADIWSSGSHHMDGVETIVLTILISYFFVTWIFAALGIVIAKRRQCPIPCLAIYGVLLFLVVMLPLFIEGTSFQKLGSIDNEEIDEYCDKSPRGIRRAGNRMFGSFFMFAHNFDKLSSNMLDRHMCTSKCPCLDYGKNPSTAELFRSDKEKLEKHNRTFNPIDTSKLYMNFTKNESLGFRNFFECYNHWYDIALEDAQMEIHKIFVVNESRGDRDGPGGRGGRGGPRGRGGRGGRGGRDDDDDWEGEPPGRRGKRHNRHPREKPAYMLSHLSQMEMYQELEDQYDCSGMCETSLFSFGIDLHWGPPEKTCIVEFRDYVAGHVSGFATSSILGGIVALFLFIIHWTMFWRPQPEQSQDAIQVPNATVLQDHSALEMPNYHGDYSQAAIPEDADKVFQQPSALAKQNEI